MIWRCNSKYEGEQRCHSTHVREDDIKEGFLRVMMEIIPRKTAVIATCQQVLNETMETESIEKKLEALNKQEESLHRQIEGIVGEFARAAAGVRRRPVHRVCGSGYRQRNQGEC